MPIAGEDATAPVIQLEPTYDLEMVLVNEDGIPAANTSARVTPVVDGDSIFGAGRRIPVDESGILRVNGIVRGIEYIVDPVFEFDPRGNPLPRGFTPTTILVP